MIGREGFSEAFCPSLEDRHRYGHCHYPGLQGRPQSPGKQGRPSIKYVINRELGQVNTVRTGGLHIPRVWPGTRALALFPVMLLDPEMLLHMATSDWQPGC